MPLHYLSRITYTYRSHSNLCRVIQATQALISAKIYIYIYHGIIEKFTRIQIDTAHTGSSTPKSKCQKCKRKGQSTACLILNPTEIPASQLLRWHKASANRTELSEYYILRVKIKREKQMTSANLHMYTCICTHVYLETVGLPIFY